MDATDSGGQRKRTGRRAGPTASNRAILEIARRQFSQHGYEGTTMRTIAQEAAVDSALIHHFFLTKEGLFEAAVRDAFSPPDLVSRALGGPTAGVGERTVRIFVKFWDEPEMQARLTGVLRSVTALEGAASLVRGFLGDEVLCPLTAALGRRNSRLRAAMVGSQLIGLATVRYVLRIPPLAAVSLPKVSAMMAPNVQSYLVGPL